MLQEMRRDGFKYVSFDTSMKDRGGDKDFFLARDHRRALF
jgi:hypothetical protein